MKTIIGSHNVYTQDPLQTHDEPLHVTPESRVRVIFAHTDLESLVFLISSPVLDIERSLSMDLKCSVLFPYIKRVALTATS